LKAILTDITKCIGCFECVKACKDEHQLGSDVPRFWHRKDGLSAKNWTTIIQKPDQHYVRKQCRHCLDPACVSACPVAALEKTPEGPVIYDADKCIGCRYCFIACPYEIPRYNWENAAAYVQKCSFCYERIKTGGQPACTEICPTQATIFGSRDELLSEAHRRIKNNPDKYIQKVYGEFEIGGTSVIYISDIDLGFLTEPFSLQKEAVPELTKLAMQSVPFAFAGMGAAMGGIYWIIKRRQKLMNNNIEDEKSNEQSE